MVAGTLWRTRLSLFLLRAIFSFSLWGMLGAELWRSLTVLALPQKKVEACFLTRARVCALTLLLINISTLYIYIHRAHVKVTVWLCFGFLLVSFWFFLIYSIVLVFCALLICIFLLDFGNSSR